MASTPSLVLGAIVPPASLYPQAAGIHFAIAESEGVPLVDLERASWANRPPLNFMDVAICHVVFDSEPRKLKAQIERDSTWVKKAAAQWLETATPAQVRQTLVDLETHIIDSFKTATDFEEPVGGKKKHEAVAAGSSP